MDYVPPEGGGTSAGDVYTLGTIFYEALTARPLGHLPEREILHGSTLDRLIRQMESTPASLRGLLKSMLDFRPEARPTLLQASETLMRCLPSLPGPDLGAWLSHQPEEADAPTAVISAMPPPPPPTPISASSPPTILRPPPRTAQKGVSVWIWVAAGVGLLGVCCGLLTILTGVGAWFLYR